MPVVISGDRLHLSDMKLGIYIYIYVRIEKDNNNTCVIYIASLNRYLLLEIIRLGNALYSKCIPLGVRWVCVYMIYCIHPFDILDVSNISLMRTYDRTTF